jgi:hypothetical protein
MPAKRNRLRAASGASWAPEKEMAATSVPALAGHD